MKLTNLLQLTNDIDGQTKLFLTINQRVYPLAKLKISSKECLLYPGKQAMTKGKMIHLVKNIHGFDIPTYMVNQQELLPVFGIQILPEQNSIRLT